MEVPRARIDDVFMRPAHNGDGVDLNVAEVPEHSSARATSASEACAAVQAGRGDRNAA